MKKKIIPIVVVLLVIGLVSGYIYCSNHPKIQVGIGGGHGMEQIHIAFSTTFDIPIAKEIQKHLIEIQIWNNGVVSKLVEDSVEPRDIKVSGEVVDGKTILRYEGYYTSKNGEQVQYFEEKTFDFVLVSEEELFK